MDQKPPGNHEDRDRRKRGLAERWAFVAEDLHATLSTLRDDEAMRDAEVVPQHRAAGLTSRVTARRVP